jgi:hypothetical protein
MKLELGGTGASPRRWHGKVARRAVSAVAEKLRAARESRMELWVEFDETPGTAVRIIEKALGDRIFLTVVLRTCQWRTLDSSLPNAVSQVEAAVSALVPEMALLLRPAAIPVARSRKVLHDIPGHHLMVALDQSIAEAAFFAFVDSLEVELARRNRGCVTGTGCGVFGWCVDLATEDTADCVALVQSLATDRGLGIVRVV